MGAVVCACGPSYVGSGGSRFQARPGEKMFVRAHFNGKKMDIVVYACYPRNDRQHKMGGSQSRPGWAKHETLLISKTAKA
jgi:hypothetical protein